MEATGGFEPPNRGFADLRLRPLGYVAWKCDGAEEEILLQSVMGGRLWPWAYVNFARLAVGGPPWPSVGLDVVGILVGKAIAVAAHMVVCWVPSPINLASSVTIVPNIPQSKMSEKCPFACPRMREPPTRYWSYLLRGQNRCVCGDVMCGGKPANT